MIAIYLYKYLLKLKLAKNKCENGALGLAIKLLLNKKAKTR